MSKSGFVVVSVLALAAASSANAASQPVTVYLDRDGGVVTYGNRRVAMPDIGISDPVWSSVVTCVRRQFAPFQVAVVDERPVAGRYITAMFGGMPWQLGLDNWMHGWTLYNPGRVTPNAVAHVFASAGPRDAFNLCAIATHEVLHTLGLDHVHYCGDVMSYLGDRCGRRRILDVDAACGEFAARQCSNGAYSQNSYRRVAAAVGLRSGASSTTPTPTTSGRPTSTGRDTSHLPPATSRAPAADPWGEFAIESTRTERDLIDELAQLILLLEGSEF